VARAGSLAGAAATLRTSEATVGRHLATLEEALGLRLFDRLANRLRLTRQGEQLLEPARAMEERALDLARRAQAVAAAPAAPVRITATGSVSLFLLRHIPSLQQAALPAPIELIVTRDPLDLARGEAEIALRMRQPPERGQLVVRRLGRIAFSLFGRPDAVAGRTESLLPLIGLRDDSASRQARWLQSFAPDARPALRLGDVRLRLDAALAGQGVALLPCFLGDPEAGLVRVLAPPPELEEDVFLLVHQDLAPLPQVRAVMDELVRLFRAQAETLLGTIPRPAP
jgi:DNA-binding transcriptional LysR family regulator